MIAVRYAPIETLTVLLVGAAATIAVALLAGWWAAAPAVLAAALLAFYRDPPRRIPADENILLAPADGVIKAIAREAAPLTDPANAAATPTTPAAVGGPADAPPGATTPTDAAPPRTLTITIFLSVLDVHINRMPCAGRVVERRRRAGGYRNALSDEATRTNEAVTLVLEPHAPLTSVGVVRVTQIAGLLARRIVCTAQPGHEFAAGRRYGMIKLGSQTQLAVRDDGGWEVLVQTGQRVRGGETALLRRIRS